jgi:hypothetical protein
MSTAEKKANRLISIRKKKAPALLGAGASETRT